MDKELGDPALTVVVPVYNEGETLSSFAPTLIQYCCERGWLVIFVNDGSQDNTRQILQEYSGYENVQLIHHKVNRGYGGALKSGISQVSTPFLVTIDGDGQHRPDDIEKIYIFATQEDADMVVGKRIGMRSSSLYRLLGKFIIRTFASMLIPLSITDLNSGFKFYRTELAQRYITICPDSMAFSDVITLVFLSERNLVLEYPIKVFPRRVGRSVVNTFTAFETVIQVLNIALMFDPLKIFLPISLLSIFAGVGWGIPIVLLGRGVSVGAMLAIVTGLLFFVLGLIASQLSSIRMEKLRNPSSNSSVNAVDD